MKAFQKVNVVSVLNVSFRGLPRLRHLTKSTWDISATLKLYCRTQIVKEMMRKERMRKLVQHGTCTGKPEKKNEELL